MTSSLGVLVARYLFAHTDNDASFCAGGSNAFTWIIRSNYTLQAMLLYEKNTLWDSNGNFALCQGALHQQENYVPF